MIYVVVTMIIKEGRMDDFRAIAEELAREDPTSPLLAIYVEAVNDVIDVESERSTAGVHVRVVSMPRMRRYILGWVIMGSSASLCP